MVTHLYCMQLYNYYVLLNYVTFNINCTKIIYIFLKTVIILTWVWGCWFAAGIVEAPDHNIIPRINVNAIQCWGFQYVITLGQERIPSPKFSHLLILKLRKNLVLLLCFKLIKTKAALCDAFVHLYSLYIIHLLVDDICAN